MLFYADLCLGACVSGSQCQLASMDISAELYLLYLPAVDITSVEIHCSTEVLSCCSQSIDRPLKRTTKAVTT